MINDSHLPANEPRGAHPSPSAPRGGCRPRPRPPSPRPGPDLAPGPASAPSIEGLGSRPALWGRRSGARAPRPARGPVDAQPQPPGSGPGARRPRRLAPAPGACPGRVGVKVTFGAPSRAGGGAGCGPIGAREPRPAPAASPTQLSPPPAPRPPRRRAPRAQSAGRRRSAAQAAAREDAAAPGMAPLALWPVAPEEGKGSGAATRSGSGTRRSRSARGSRSPPHPQPAPPNFARRGGRRQTDSPRPRTGLSGASWLGAGDRTGDAAGRRGEGGGRSATRECARRSGSVRQTDSQQGGSLAASPRQPRPPPSRSVLPPRHSRLRRPLCAWHRARWAPCSEPAHPEHARAHGRTPVRPNLATASRHISRGDPIAASHTHTHTPLGGAKDGGRGGLEGGVSPPSAASSPRAPGQGLRG